MIKSTIIFLRSFPLEVIAWKIRCKLFGIKIPDLQTWQQPFRSRNGIEIGGPSGMFNTKGFLPLYDISGKIDGVNFSNTTVWEGDIEEGEFYKYQDKTGYQYIAEGTKLNKIKEDNYEFVLSCNNLEHMANPLAAIFEWKRILKNEGAMLLILPNKEANFDHRRPYTSIEHLIMDFENNIGEDDMTHIDEVLQLHDLRRDPQGQPEKFFIDRSKDNLRNRCLHHHVFSQQLLSQMFEFCGMQTLKQYSSLSDHFILGRK